MTQSTPTFARLGCALCRAQGCRYCDPQGNDRAAHASHLDELRTASPERQRELRQRDYYQAHRWVDAAGGWVY